MNGPLILARGSPPPCSLQQMHYEMEDLIEQANEVQESMSRTYGVPDEVDEADLEAGAFHFISLRPWLRTEPSGRASIHPSSSCFTELDALGDDLAEDEEGIPSYLREEGTELPDFVDEAPTSERPMVSHLLPPSLSRYSAQLTFVCTGTCHPVERRGHLIDRRAPFVPFFVLYQCSIFLSQSTPLPTVPV